MSFHDLVHFVRLSCISIGFVICLTQAVTVSNSSSAVPTYTWHYNHSSVFNPSINLNVNGTGTAYAYACASASQSWSWASSSRLEEAQTTWPVVPLYTTTSTITKQFWDIWTTDCDGITHARGTSPTSISVFPNATVYTDYTITPSYTTPPEPSCLIQPSDCKAVLESYSAETSALESWATASLTVPFYVTSRPVMPSCTSICTAPPDCVIMGDHVQLIYWPVTTTGANSCGTNGTTVSSTEDGSIKTIETLGTIFTSPTQYLSFRSLSAWDWGCNTQIGNGVAGTIIPIKPGHLSSARGWHLGRSPYSFNLADLNGFVTSAAYFQMQHYDWSGPGETIFDDLYYPTIWLPDIVTQIRPEWSTCGLSPFGVNDPPVQLTSVARVDPATTKAPIGTPGYDLTHGSATPGATPTSTVKPSILPDGYAHPKPTSKQASATAQAQTTKIAKSKNLADYIASALGYHKGTTTDQQTVVVTKTIVLGPKGVSMHGQSGTTPLAEVYSDVVSPSLVSTAVGLAYVAVFTMIEGRTAVVGDGMTLAVGGEGTQLDGGYSASAAEGGLVLDGVTIPYATEKSSSAPSAGETLVEPAATTSSSGSVVAASSINVPATQTASLASSNFGTMYGASFALVAGFIATIFVL